MITLLCFKSVSLELHTEIFINKNNLMAGIWCKVIQGIILVLPKRHSLTLLVVQIWQCWILSVFICLNTSLFHQHFWKIFLPDRIQLWWFRSLNTLSRYFSTVFWLTWYIANEKFDVTSIFFLIPLNLFFTEVLLIYILLCWFQIYNTQWFK